ncbi:hypothetical protein GH714_005704 [Hevea brasiliensis]|uniref:Retrotransposon gag domain-containing protein n=1 Tax=Hevea brasiliensis TaxID=3981 RepID=A0A6A6MC01_HEVBR|nr:hypothetical protein GH714_005704 [Hevea brasiliensis]
MAHQELVRIEKNVGRINPWGSNAKLEFPHFSGEELEGWLLKEEYFFEVGRIEYENRVKAAVLHLENCAIQWHQGFIKTKGAEAYTNWDEFDNTIQENVSAIEKELQQVFCQSLERFKWKESSAEVVELSWSNEKRLKLHECTKILDRCKIMENEVFQEGDDITNALGLVIDKNLSRM